MSRPGEAGAGIGRPFRAYVLRRKPRAYPVVASFSREDVGHEWQADACPDFAGQGHADESAGLFAEGSDRSRRYELARDREVRFRFPAIAVVDEDERSDPQRLDGPLEIHGRLQPGRIYQDY